MKKSYIFLFLAYIVFHSGSFSQNIYLNIEGTNVNETRILDSLGYKKQLPDISSLQEEKDNLVTRLYKIGYIENREVSSIKANDSTYAVQYELNTLYKAIHVRYDEKVLPSRILSSMGVRSYDGYFESSFNKIESVLNAINSSLADDGKPFLKTQLKDIFKKGPELLQADLFITEERDRTIDKIVLNGYEKFPKAFVKRYLRIRLKDEFNLNDIKERTEALNELPFASQIKPPEVLFTEDSTTLYMYLKKSPSNSFDGFLGFGTNENTNKIEFDGYLDLSLNNNLNYGESLRLLYKSDEIDQKTFQADIELPYLFNTPLGLDLQLNIFKKDSSFTTINQNARLFYQLNSRSKVLAGISATQSNDLLDNSGGLMIDDYDTAFYSLGYSYVVRQPFDNLFPVNLDFEIEVGTGKRTFDGNDLEQSSVSYDVFKIFNFNKNNSIYLRSNGSFLFSDNYLFNELYRFGGINSIRGFEENSLFASLYALLNTEYRYRLSSNIYVNSIIDAAYFENELSGTKEKLFGFGFGFGLLTNSGLLRLNYANGKSENQNFKLSDSKIHISLTARF